MKNLLGYLLIFATITLYSCYGNGGQEDSDNQQTEYSPSRQIEIRYVDTDKDTLNQEEVEARQTEKSTDERLRGEP